MSSVLGLAVLLGFSPKPKLVQLQQRSQPQSFKLERS